MRCVRNKESEKTGAFSESLATCQMRLLVGGSKRSVNRKLCCVVWNGTTKI